MGRTKIVADTKTTVGSSGRPGGGVGGTRAARRLRTFTRHRSATPGLAAERENTLALPDEELLKSSPDQAFVRGYIRNAARVWYNPRFDCTPLWQDVTINIDMFGYVWGKVFAEIDIAKGLEHFAV